ncbi:MAG: DNA adenine methylase [SAR324 cluster bacterium]|nr:DNA adenine methylase [SAR324 cluster bacterium]
MAKALVQEWSSAGDLVVDPFCGCGVVPLEAASAGRRVVAGDWNPYAVLLTNAKLFSPQHLRAAERRLRLTWELSRTLLSDQDLRKVPKWVRRFFHPERLRNALAGFAWTAAHPYSIYGTKPRNGSPATIRPRKPAPCLSHQVVSMSRKRAIARSRIIHRMQPNTSVISTAESLYSWGIRAWRHLISGSRQPSSISPPAKSLAHWAVRPMPPNE